MSFIDASTTQLALVAETTEGITPTSPVYQKTRYTGDLPQYEKTTITSDEIRPDRNIADNSEVARKGVGGFNFEFSQETFDALLQSALGGTWATNTLKNGTDRHAFSIEQKFLAGALNKYVRQRGMLVNTMSLDITAQQIVTGNFDFLGQGGSASDSAVAGATYLDATTTAVLNAGSSFASLTISGVSPSPTIMSLSMSMTNNLREQAEVGEIDLAGIGVGRFELTGSMSAYFEDLSLYNAFLDHDDIALAFVIGDTNGKYYRFTIPKIKLSSNKIENAGNNQDVMLNLDYTALFSEDGSPAYDCTLQIERLVTV